MRPVNLRRDTFDVRCDRKSPLGNPFIMRNESDREQVIQQYDEWLATQIENKNPLVFPFFLAIKEGDRLGCWCYPKACHVDSIIKHRRKYMEEVENAQ